MLFRKCTKSFWIKFFIFNKSINLILYDLIWFLIYFEKNHRFLWSSLNFIFSTFLQKLLLTLNGCRISSNTILSRHHRTTTPGTSCSLRLQRFISSSFFRRTELILWRCLYGWMDGCMSTFRLYRYETQYKCIWTNAFYIRQSCWFTYVKRNSIYWCLRDSTYWS